MAKHLSIVPNRIAIVGALAVVLGGVQSIAAAQVLADPTRPPSTGAEQPVGTSAPTSGPILQSVLISPRRAEAIISGRTVKVGDKVGDAKVVRITETEVVLRNGKEQQTLKLFPNIEKQSNSSRIGANVNNR